MQEAFPPKCRWNVVLYQPEIPPNTGNVGRTCLAVGAKLWLVRPLGFRLDQRSLRRAGMDYWDQLHWEAVDHWQELEQKLDPRRMWLLTKHASHIYWNASFAEGDTLVFGSESAGLPAPLRERYANRLLRIPVQPAARSLNLANAVAVVLYEAERQCPRADC